VAAGAGKVLEELDLLRQVCAPTSDGSRIAFALSRPGVHRPATRSASERTSRLPPSDVRSLALRVASRTARAALGVCRSRRARGRPWFDVPGGAGTMPVASQPSIRPRGTQDSAMPPTSPPVPTSLASGPFGTRATPSAPFWSLLAARSGSSTGRQPGALRQAPAAQAAPGVPDLRRRGPDHAAAHGQGRQLCHQHHLRHLRRATGSASQRAHRGCAPSCATRGTSWATTTSRRHVESRDAICGASSPSSPASGHHAARQRRRAHPADLPLLHQGVRARLSEAPAWSTRASPSPARCWRSCARRSARASESAPRPGPALQEVSHACALRRPWPCSS